MSEAILEASQTISESKTSRFTIIRRILIFFTALMIFSLFKLPDTKLKGHLNHYIFRSASEMGYNLSATDSELHFGLGLSYTLKDVTLSPKGSASLLRLDSIMVSPSILALLFGKMGGSLEVKKGKGNISGDIGVRGSNLTAHLTIDSLDLSDSPLALVWGDFKAKAQLNGEIKIEGPLNDPSQWNGGTQLKLGAIRVDSQSIMSFPIPEVKIAGAEIKIKIDKGTALIENLSLGTLNKKTDDIAAKISGDIMLKPRLDMSILKLNAHFSFAPEYLDKSELFLIQSFISAAKQMDGSFQYAIAGPLYSPSFNPVKQ